MQSRSQGPHEDHPPGYTLIARLGRGAQADVYLARRNRDRQEVAIKVVRHDDLDRRAPGSPDRLRREARVLAAIESPHVVHVHECVVTTAASYLVMELLNGQSLASALGERSGNVRPFDDPHTAAADDQDATILRTDSQTARALAESERRPRLRTADVPVAFRNRQHVDWAVGIAVQVAMGLRDLHSVNLFHRDIKPANIMLVDGGTRAVITDFGMAHRPGESTITAANLRSGTPHYWSPEQAAGARGAAPSDVFSLGATLFDCLTGWTPLHQGSMAPPRTWRLPRLDALLPETPRDLVAIVHRALEIDVRDRYPDGAALLADLERFQRGDPVTIPFRWGRLWRHHGQRLIALAAVALLVVTAALAFQMLSLDWFVDDLIAAARANDPGRLRTTWFGADDQRREAALPRLSTALVDEPDRLWQLAATCELAAVPVEPTSDYLVTLCRSDRPLPPLSAFAAPTRGMTFLATPGTAWLLVVPVDRLTWWAPDDPLCFSFLRSQTRAGPTPEPATAPWSCVRPVVGNLTKLVEPQWFVPVSLPNALGTAAGDLLMVGRTELSARLLRAGAAVVGSLQIKQPAVARQLAHPDEEPDAMARLHGNGVAGSKSEPGMAELRIAWRVACLFGCRLPTRSEWAALQSGARGPCLTLTAPAVPVDTPTDTDRSTAGCLWVNGNEAEWVVADDYGSSLWAAGARLPEALEAAPPMSTVNSGKYGMRLVRSRIRIAD